MSKPQKFETDILVAGGGIAGMIATLVFVGEGFQVTCVDAAPKPGKASAKDLRSTAFLMPSIRLLEDAGIFEGLSEIATPLKLMRIVDAGGIDPIPRETVDFDASDAGEEQFGWNIPNAALRDQLLDQIESNAQITMMFENAVEAITTRSTGAIARLKSGTQITAHLVVAADGRGSRLRELAGIDVTTIRYGQKALVFQVSHEMPHEHISTEVHRSGGPFTLVPLAGDDQRASAVVWMSDGPDVDRLAKLTDDAFEDAVNLRSANVMGPLKLTSKRAVWPIISQYASGLIGQRLALIGEAAHVVPPIGAQGLNMSLADIGALRDLMSEVDERKGIGADHILEEFQRKRWLDMRVRVQGIDALNRASMAGSAPLRDLRSTLLSILGKTESLKRNAIRAGLGQ